MEMHPDWVNNILYLIKCLNGNILPMPNRTLRSKSCKKRLVDNFRMLLAYMGNKSSNDILLMDQLELHGRISDIIGILFPTISIQNRY